MSLVSVAALLILLAIACPRGTKYTSEATFVIERDTPGEESAEERDGKLRALFLDPSNLSAIAGQLEAVAVDSPELQGSGPDRLPSVLGRQLRFVVERDGNGQEMVHVRYASSSREAANQVVGAAARHLAESHLSSLQQVPQERRQVDDQVDQLKNQLHDLRNGRERFMNDTLAQLRERFIESLSRDSNSGPGTDSLASDESNALPEPELSLPSPTEPQHDKPEVVAAPPRTDDTWPTHPADDLAASPPKPDQGDDAFRALQPPADIRPPENALSVTPFRAPLPNTGGPFVNSNPGAPPPDGNSGDWTDLAPAETTDPPIPHGATKSRSPLPTILNLNPRWTAISDAISRTRLELEKLRQDFTDRHPRVVDLQLQLDELNAELGKTQRYVEESLDKKADAIPSFSPVPDGLAPTSAESAGPLLQPVPDDRTAIASQFDEQAARTKIAETEEFAALSREISAVEEELAAAILQRSATPRLRSEESARLVSDATVVAETGASVTPFDLLTLLLPAGVMGLVAAMVRTKMVAPELLYSVADVEESLPVPMMGMVSTKDGPTIPTEKPGGPPGWVNTLVFGSELVCLAAFTLLLIGALQIPGFFAELLQNPLQAYVRSFDHIASIVTHL